MFQNINSLVAGHITITDKITGEVLVDRKNAINFENFSICLARSIANRPDSWIQEMCFGNGGATVSEIGTITYLPPNTIGMSAQLYNETYYKVVDDQNPLNLDVTNNFIQVAHSTGSTYSDTIVTCTLELGEPANQLAFDTNTDIETSYSFNEIGLKAYSSNGPDTGLLLTHVIFSPILKSLNRILQIVYTIRIQTV
jgi:hypothetical protein